MGGDETLRDEQLEQEIELVGTFVLEAGSSTGRLSERRIDEILGVTPDTEPAAWSE